MEVERAQARSALPPCAAPHLRQPANGAPVIGQKAIEIDAHHSANLHEFGEIEPPFPTFEFGYETLRARQGCGDLDLGQARFFTRADQHGAKYLVLRTMDGIGHPRTVITRCGISQSGLFFRRPCGRHCTKNEV